MNLRTKFTLILTATSALALVVMGVFSYQIIYRNADQEIRERASLMLEAAMSMRTYTIKNVKPLVSQLSSEDFHPETVPAFAAMRAFDILRVKHSDYTYREAALNPTNPTDRAVDWESDIIAYFRNNASATEVSNTRSTPTGEVLYIARPIQITNASCLDCHNTADTAPASVVRIYGANNGFGWKLNEIVGAQIVTVPASVTYDRARSTFLVFMGSLTVAGLLALITLNVAMRAMVVRPITRLSTLCDEVSKGNFSAGTPKITGNDEIAGLASSFGRMRISLQKAMKMLGG